MLTQESVVIADRGAGVRATDITRITDEFLVAELRRQSSVVARSETVARYPRRSPRATLRSASCWRCCGATTRRSTRARAVGFAAGITATPEDYVLTARPLASRPELLAACRRNLRADMARSSLCDHPGHARALEEAYRAVWRIWCAQG